MPPVKLASNKNRLLAVALAVLVVTGVSVAIFGMSASRAQTDAATGAAVEAPATPVSVATVVQSDVAAWDEFSGRLEAVERVDVRSRVAGAVQSVHFREGALVKKGDLLLTIDPAPYAAEVERAEAQVAAAQARVAQAKGEHERAQRLWSEQRHLAARIRRARQRDSAKPRPTCAARRQRCRPRA